MTKSQSLFPGYRPSRRRMGQIARLGLCLIMAGVALYGLLGLVSAVEAEGVFVSGSHEPATGSIPTNGGCATQFLIGNGTIGSLALYIGGGLIPVAAAGLFLLYRQQAGNNDHGIKTVKNWRING